MKLLLQKYFDSKKSTSENSKILQSTTKYIFATKWFDESHNHTSNGHTYMHALYYIYVYAYIHTHTHDWYVLELNDGKT